MKVDVRVKFILLFYANFLLLVRIQGWMQMVFVLLLVLLFIISGYWKKGLVYAALFFAMEGYDLWIFDSLVGDLSSLSSMLFVGGKIMLPCFMAGSLVLTTTSVHELITTLRKVHLPEGLILTMAVMMRYMPTVSHERRVIRQSLVLRGIFPDWKSRFIHPVKYFECVIVPLMMSAGRVAQELTIATLTKGVGIPGKRTSYREYRMTLMDWGVLVVLFCHAIAVEVLK